MTAHETDRDTAARRRPHRRDEDAFTQVEMLAAIVILCILMSIGFVLYKSAKKAALVKQARIATTTYGTAVASFKLSNANMAPRFGSADWPTAINGPINTLTGKPYIKGGVPQAVTVGLSSPALGVRVQSGGTPLARGGTLIYMLDADRIHWELASYWDGVHQCSVGDRNSSTIRSRPCR